MLRPQPVDFVAVVSVREDDNITEVEGRVEVVDTFNAFVFKPTTHLVDAVERVFVDRGDVVADFVPGAGKSDGEFETESVV
jgi:hypothetical protein